jgi:hypothetical protein
MLTPSHSFNGNDFASDKLVWRSEKPLISDGAASSSVVLNEEDMRCSFLHRFILFFQFYKFGTYVSCNLILSYE